MKSRVMSWLTPILWVAALAVPLPLVAQVAGHGAANHIPIWTNSTTLGNSIIFQKNGKVGIGTTLPGSRIDVRLGNGDGDLLFGNPFNPGRWLTGEGRSAAPPLSGAEQPKLRS